MTIPDAPISAVMPAAATDAGPASSDSLGSLAGGASSGAPGAFALLLSTNVPGTAPAGVQGQPCQPAAAKDKDGNPLAIGLQAIATDLAPAIILPMGKKDAVASNADPDEFIGDGGKNDQPAKDETEDLQPAQQIAVAAMLYMIPPSQLAPALPQPSAGGQAANGQAGVPIVTLPAGFTGQSAATGAMPDLPPNSTAQQANSASADPFDSLVANSSQTGASLPLSTTAGNNATTVPQASGPIAPAAASGLPGSASNGATSALLGTTGAMGESADTDSSGTPADSNAAAASVANPAASVSAANGTGVDGFPVPDTGDAKIAAPTVASFDPAKNGAAKTSVQATEFVAPTVVRAAMKMPADADVSLGSGVSDGVKKGRGMAGAKGGNAMENRPFTNNSLHAQQGGGVAGNGPAKPVTAAMSREQQDGSSDGNRESLNRATSESSSRDTSTPTFSVPAPELHTSAARTDTATTPAAASRGSNAVSASAVLDEVSHNLARIQSHGNTRVDLQVALEDGGHVSVQLQFRDGAVHASFQTSSPEMRDALQQGWTQMAARSESSGIPLGDAVFKSPSGMLGSNGGQQQFREHRQPDSQPQEMATPDSPATPFNQPKRGNRAPSLSQSTTSGLSLWA